MEHERDESSATVGTQRDGRRRARITDVEHYSSWWPWLRRFDPGTGFQPDARWRCEVAPPLPYVVRFVLTLEQVDAPQRAVARVSGDIGGAATLTIEPGPGGGTRARLVSQLAPTNPLLRSVGALARPMVEWGHDWVLDQGQRQFARSLVADDHGPEGSH